jgi:ADP-heptose:LPS heptosyltransferase
MIQNTPREKILVMRFSALGDVALTVPVLKAFLDFNPDKELVMLSNQQLSGLFEGIERLNFIGADLKKEHKGIIGVFRIFNMVRTQIEFSTVVDLHSVVRTYILRCLFTVLKKRTAGVKKSRFENFALTRKENKIFRPLPHATERYIKVFESLGFGVAHLSSGPDQIISKPIKVSPKLKIGFAPFAKHNTKMYNLDKFKEIVRHFDKKPYQLYFFGGTVAEKLLIGGWEKEFKQVNPQHHVKGFKQELELMQEMQVMVTMDSANMHLASLVNVPVVSIWGPTHPYSGFYGLHQNPLHAVQVNISCRPCSVFGNKSCWRGDHACMDQITPGMVIEKVEGLLMDQQP